MKKFANNQTIVCLPGFGFSPAIWNALTSELSSPLQLMSLPAIDETFTIEMICENIISSCPPHSILMGWSLGGMIAIKLASMFPSRFKKLILIASTARMEEDDNWPGIHSKAIEELLLSAKNNINLYIKNFLRWCNYPNKNTHHLDLIHQYFHSGSSGYPYLSLLFSQDLRDDFSKLSLPVIHFTGKRDAVISPLQAHALNKTLPHTVEVIEQAGHSLPLTHADMIAKRIQQWII